MKRRSRPVEKFRLILDRERQALGADRKAIGQRTLIVVPDFIAVEASTRRKSYSVPIRTTPMPSKLLAWIALMYL
jgi:hypothetical protein